MQNGWFCHHFTIFNNSYMIQKQTNPQIFALTCFMKCFNFKESLSASKEWQEKVGVWGWSDESWSALYPTHALSASICVSAPSLSFFLSSHTQKTQASAYVGIYMHTCVCTHWPECVTVPWPAPHWNHHYLPQRKSLNRLPIKPSGTAEVKCIMEEYRCCTSQLTWQKHESLLAGLMDSQWRMRSEIHFISLKFVCVLSESLYTKTYRCFLTSLVWLTVSQQIWGLLWSNKMHFFRECT